MNREILAVVAMSVGVVVATESAEAQSIRVFSSLSGVTASSANGISKDGSTVVGLSDGDLPRATRQVSGGGVENLGALSATGFSTASGVSGDGSVVVGWAATFGGENDRAVRWTSSGGLQSLGVLSGDSSSVAWGVSGDGSTIVGQSFGNQSRAFRWTSGGGMQALGLLSPLATGSQAVSASDDGSTIVGSIYGPLYGGQAVRWTSSGVEGLGFLAGFDRSYAYGVSGDGLKIVGQSSLENSDIARAFLWSGNSMQDLGVLAGQTSSMAVQVSDDGSTVVGYCTDADFNITAMIWQSGVGMTSLSDALLSRGVDLTGWDKLESALDISADGRFIVGNGVFNGENRGFVVDLGMPVPAPGALGLLGLAAAVGGRRRR